MTATPAISCFAMVGRVGRPVRISSIEDRQLGTLVVDAVGVSACVCLMISFIPQIAKIIRAKDVEGVSLKMFAVTATAFALWTLYGVLQASWPLMLSNAICLLLVSA